MSDNQRMYTYNSNDGATIYVFGTCPECGKYLKRGIVLQNADGKVKVEKWMCKRHNEVQPIIEIL